jgi:hypothetical protein
MTIARFLGTPTTQFEIHTSIQSALLSTNWSTDVHIEYLAEVCAYALLEYSKKFEEMALTVNIA